jgi:ABC-2 type transport system ATP-binding protein
LAFPQEDVVRLGLRVEPQGDRWEVVTGNDADAIDRVLALLTEKGLRLRYLLEKKQTLEDVFVSMVDQAAPGTDDRRRVRTARPVVARRAE